MSATSSTAGDVARRSPPPPPHGCAVSEAQADYSFAEWWVLAQAEWLIMLYPSAYSTTAAEVGFGTAGWPRPPALSLLSCDSIPPPPFFLAGLLFLLVAATLRHHVEIL